MPKRFLKLDEIKTTTGLSRSSIYDKVKKGDFPAPVKLGERSVAWVSEEIDFWLDARIADRNGKGKGNSRGVHK